MEKSSTARVTSQYLDKYIGHNVMVVGKVTQIRGESALVDSEGPITIQLNREAHVAVGNAVQVIGKVNPDLSIRALSSLDLGTGIDLELQQKVAAIAEQHKELFQYDGATGDAVMGNHH